MDSLFAVLLEELPAALPGEHDAARNMQRRLPPEAYAKGMSALMEIAGRNDDWDRAVAEVRELAAVLVVDLTNIEALVTRVIDGDTIDVILADGTTATVRYANTDAPELGEACSDEATAFNRALVGGRNVTLKLPYDPENRIDRYGRLVRNVFVHDPNGNREIWANWYLILEGFAVHWGDARHASGELRPTADAELDAMLAGAGCLWRS